TDCGRDADRWSSGHALRIPEQRGESREPRPAFRAYNRGVPVIGKTLGNYQILDRLGEGGMGSVYRAHDTHLGRDVAIKVVRPECAADRERVARLEREAKALAALNHPGIATLYGFEHADGRDFLVMELVAGQTLADRLVHQPLLLESTLQI